jgi:signal transduction histidine kinase
MRRGCRDFIDKPFEPEALHQKVEMLLEDIDRRRTREKANANHVRTGTRALVHDLNNLLGGAVGYADLALEDCRRSECPTAYIEKIMASTTLAARVCQSILSRGVEENDMRPILTTTEIATVVERAGAAIAGIAPDTITVTVEVSECQVWIRADAQLLQRAILNLAINAMDAMPEGGTLTISLTKTRQQGAPDIEPTERVVIAVADTGPGIAPETLEHIFDEGYTTKPHGHGLGLPAVKAVAEGHGGGVEIAGSEGGGTVVTLILPHDGTSHPS